MRGLWGTQVLATSSAHTQSQSMAAAGQALWGNERGKGKTFAQLSPVCTPKSIISSGTSILALSARNDPSSHKPLATIELGVGACTCPNGAEEQQIRYDLLGGFRTPAPCGARIWTCIRRLARHIGPARPRKTNPVPATHTARSQNLASHIAVC